jgi:hypothetical protein
MHAWFLVFSMGLLYYVMTGLIPMYMKWKENWESDYIALGNCIVNSAKVVLVVSCMYSKWNSTSLFIAVVLPVSQQKSKHYINVCRWLLQTYLLAWMMIVPTFGRLYLYHQTTSRHTLCTNVGCTLSAFPGPHTHTHTHTLFTLMELLLTIHMIDLLVHLSDKCSLQDIRYQFKHTIPFLMYSLISQTPSWPPCTYMQVYILYVVHTHACVYIWQIGCRMVH